VKNAQFWADIELGLSFWGLLCAYVLLFLKTISLVIGRLVLDDFNGTVMVQISE